MDQGTLPQREPCRIGTALALLMAVRVVTAALFPILPEEAYHWNFACHLDWSYYDHPPMIAWSIALGRLLLGDSPLGVRLVPLLFSLGTALLLVRLARHFYGNRAASWVVVLLALEPSVSFIGGWGFPDAPLLFFWSLTLTFVWKALEEKRGAWWLAAGAALGAGMLSKYTAAFLVPSVLAYLLSSRRDRRWLRTPWPYLAGVASLLVFSPVISWNWAHDWVSLRFQSSARFQATSGFSTYNAACFVGEQWLATLPFTLPLAAVGLWRGWRSIRPEERFLFWSFVPMMAFFFVIGCTPNCHVLWPLPAHLALTVAMAGVLVEVQDGLARWYRERAAWLVGIMAGGTALILVHVTCVLPGLPLFRETYGWDEVAVRAAEEKARLPEGSFFLGIGNRTYSGASQLAFHLGAPAEVQAGNLLGLEGLQYRFWANREQLRGKDAIVVQESRQADGALLELLRRHFHEVEPAEEIKVPVGRLPMLAQRQQRFTLYRVHGYRPEI